ncbi:uncharacterized protein LOC112538737 [Tetranychus urticae]|uniref:Uncharacterized protein n=1 Tax=Tetranychus urticae TaxID=32264 RepID=T1JQ46_TETUR|nr:uncharacterized protein LOC112538737 [Tetranychus urticae]XP_025016405.1 uncharacterized protein LOC112538737 [Tetranychus urticae]XP_025016409.1 uncharacterized protein LOC112538737 [Tetranychus urticae]
MDSVNSIEPSSTSCYGSAVSTGLPEDHQLTNTTNLPAEGSSGMLSSSKSATLITCSSSFNSECSLTLSNENLRSSPDLSLSHANLSLLKGSKFIRSCRTPSAGLLLSVPCERYGGFRRFSMQSGQRFSLSPTDTLFEEQSELILNCGALSSAVLGRIKSFSTSDITMTSGQFDGLNFPTDGFGFDSHGLKSSLSEIALFGGCVWNPRLNLPNIRSLDATSRSCSTWAMVGDRSISSVSQLPSPSQAHSVSGTLSPTLNPLDIVYSMNKKVRQMYIRQRLLSTYRTLERLSRSHLDLGNLIKGDLVNKLIKVQAEEGYEGPSLTSINKSIDVDSSSVITQLEPNETKETISNIPPALANTFNLSPSNSFTKQDLSSIISRSTFAQTNPGTGHADKNEIDPVKTSTDNSNDNDLNNNSKHGDTSSASKFQERLTSTSLDLIQLQNDLFSLSVRDIELQKGKPLTKYERNMMIFNWLQNLDQEESN